MTTTNPDADVEETLLAREAPTRLRVDHPRGDGHHHHPAVPSGTTAEVRLPGEPAAVVGPGTHHFTATANGGTAHKPELVRSAP